MANAPVDHLDQGRLAHYPSSANRAARPHNGAPIEADGLGGASHASAPSRVSHAETTIASGDRLDVRRFQVTERVSSMFEIHLVAVCENADIDFEAAIGRPMTFAAHSVHSRAWSGICSHLRQIAVSERNLSTYELTLVPSLWLLTQRRNHRIFQRMSEIDVVQKLLGDWSIDPALKLGGSYKKRDYRVQYGETDYAFFCRMLEDAGVSFYFDDSGQSRLVLDDSPHGNALRAPLAFRDNPTDTDREHVTQVSVGRRLRPGKVTVRDHDHRRPPSFKLMSSSSAGGVEAALERFEYTPGAFHVETEKGSTAPFGDDRGKYRADEDEGKKLAGRRLEAERASAREITFLTNVIDPAPGTVVTFLDHPKSELGPDNKLLVVESSLQGEIPGLFRHACTAVSASAPYRPAVITPKPRVQGVESATVVGPAGQEIHVDELGRVRVHFHWDREGAMDERSSCWIPTSQPWTGAGFGGVALPRVGQEVIVDFLGGDPDRPIIVGRVYTELQAAPYKLPENKTKSGWKSSSTNHTGGYNELMFEDAAGRELVRFQAEKDLHALVKHDETTKVGHDRRELVGNDVALAVGNDRAEEIGHDDASTVGRDRTTSVANNEDLTVGNDATTHVLCNAREVIGMNASRVVGVDETIDIGQTQTVHIGDAQRTKIGASQNIQIGASQDIKIAKSQSTKIGGAHSLTVKEASTEAVLLAKALTVGGGYQITVGTAMNAMVGGQSSEQVGLTKTIQAGSKIELVCGASKLVLEASGKITIEGTDIEIKSLGPAKIGSAEALEVISKAAISIKAEGNAELVGSATQIKGKPIDFNPPE